MAILQKFSAGLEELFEDTFERRNEFSRVDYSIFAEDFNILAPALGPLRDEFVMVHRKLLLNRITNYQGLPFPEPDILKRFDELARMLPREPRWSTVERITRKQERVFINEQASSGLSGYSRTESDSSGETFCKRVGSRQLFIYFHIPQKRINLDISIGLLDPRYALNICNFFTIGQLTIGRNQDHDEFAETLNYCLRFVTLLADRMESIIGKI